MFLFDQIYPSSFRGAKFFWKVATKSGGRKTVIHEYPQKDFRFVEDLGKRLSMFDVTAIVKGLNYLTEKQRLEDAITTEGLGILVHPFDGNVTVYPLSFELTEEDTEIGIAKYSLRFAEATKNFSPEQTTNVASIVANLYRELYDAVDNAISIDYTLNFIRNIEDAVQVTQRAISRLRALFRIANSTVNGRNAFRKTADSFEQDQYVITQNPESLGENFTSLFSDFDNLSVNPDSRFDTNRQAFGLGFDDTFINLPTVELAERVKNRKLLNGAFNYLVLIDLYSAVTSLTFDDEIQLNTTQELLDGFYRDLVNCENCLLSNDLIDGLNKIRNTLRRYFDNLRLTVAKVTTIDTQPTPAAVLTYNLYGSTDNYSEILKLNNWTNPAIIKGSVRVLQQ